MEFSHSSEFAPYRRLREMDSCLASDPSLRLSDDDMARLDLWPVVKNVFEKDLPEAVLVLNSFSASLKDELSVYESAVRDLEKSEKLYIFYKSVLENLTKQYLDSLSGMLTEVYRSVYGVSRKSVQLVMEDFRNKKVVKLKIINRQGGHDFAEDFSNEGGAAQVILGIIVAVYFLLTVGGERIIFIDECLSQLHNDCLFRFMKILQQFVSGLGFSFVVISHDAYRLRGFIDKAYVVEDGVYNEIPVNELDAFIESTAGVKQ
jgi:DNA repair exonuclease SbcCD ATPase subunit